MAARQGREHRRVVRQHRNAERDEPWIAKGANPFDLGVDVFGIAFSGGYGIREVTVSVDGGQSWRQAALGRDLGKYSWRQWRFAWQPARPGKHTIMARAVDSIGGSQPFEQLWSPAGYMWNKVETIDVTVG